MNKNGSASNSYVIDKSDLEKWIEMTESSKSKLLRSQVKINSSRLLNEINNLRTTKKLILLQTTCFLNQIIQIKK